mmetsp:Transcript_9002/g.15232  ORF Transcript_9002/g.15232 Transcript_9002/m.15232 type:complete len:187 (-) Transcript_9002:616-1176(-)
MMPNKQSDKPRKSLALLKSSTQSSNISKIVSLSLKNIVRNKLKLLDDQVCDQKTQDNTRGSVAEDSHRHEEEGISDDWTQEVPDEILYRPKLANQTLYQIIRSNIKERPGQEVAPRDLSLFDTVLISYNNGKAPACEPHNCDETMRQSQCVAPQLPKPIQILEISAQELTNDSQSPGLSSHIMEGK